MWTDERKEAILDLALLEASTKQKKNFRIPKKTNWSPGADGKSRNFRTPLWPHYKHNEGGKMELIRKEARKKIKWEYKNNKM